MTNKKKFRTIFRTNFCWDKIKKKIYDFKNNYPFILVRPVITNRVSEEKRKQYYKNIKNWLLLLNSFSYFPRNYNGGDPLNGSTVKKIKEFGDLILNRLLTTKVANKVKELHQKVTGFSKSLCDDCISHTKNI